MNNWEEWLFQIPNRILISAREESKQRTSWRPGGRVARASREEKAATGGTGRVSEASLCSAQFLSGTSAISLITCRQYPFSTSIPIQISVKRCVLETLLESLSFFISLMFLFTSKFSYMVCLHGKIS